MRRLIFAAAGVLVMSGCTREEPVPMGPHNGQPSFAISDGANGGNPHFYFLPPIVSSPSYSGTFNPGLAPSVEICDWSRDRTCQNYITRFAPSQVTVDTVGQKYQVNWNTDPSVDPAYDTLRIRVILGGAPTGTNGSGCPAGAGFPATGVNGCVELAYRDVQAVSSPGQIPNPNPTPSLYVFNNGSSVPIKFRIEKGALCSPTAKDCGEGTATATGGTISGTYANFVIPQGAISTTIGSVTVILQKLPCVTNGRVSLVPADLPQFQGCYDFKTIPADVPFSQSFVVGMCLLRPSGLVHAQEDLLQITKFEPTNPSAGVQVLPEATATIDCTNFGTITTASLNPIVNLARRIEGKVRSWLSPTVAFAAHLGGGTSRTLSNMVWALPAKMDTLAGSYQVVPVNTAVPIPPSVKVSDASGNPVAGATVLFTPSSGSSVTLPPSALPCLSDASKTCVPTDANGVAKVASWTVGSSSGTYTLTASGVGLRATPTTSGLLLTGSVTFTAIACKPGFGTPGAIDGVIGANEWQCAQHADFTASLSGGTAPATLYWMNDNNNLYLAVKVQRNVSDKVNTLQFNFDTVATSGGAMVGDDILIEDGVAGFSDNYLTLKCTNSSQSSCGATDVSAGGVSNGAGATTWQNGYRMYEMKHPLNSGDTGHDFALAGGKTVGLFLTLQQGSGAQGNTQWPGFRNYLKITIQQP